VSDFVTAVALVNRIKDISESEGHHPDIHITRYNNLTIEYYTHSIGGLSENDFICAAKIDELQENSFTADVGTDTKKIQLYSFWRSSCSFRVRMVLEYKGLDYNYIPVNIQIGEHKTNASYGLLNPSLTVPTLVIDGIPIPQSPAIIEFLEERFPSPSIIPSDLYDRAYTRQLAAMILDIQPLPSLLRRLFKPEQIREKEEWGRAVIHEGLQKFEKAVQRKCGNFCLGDSITVADMYLIPQVYNGIVCGIDVQSEFKKINQIYNNMMSLAFVQKASPTFQPDYHRSTDSGTKV